MRVAVIGANGFIGGHLAAALRARGDEVVACSIRDPRAAAATVADCEAIVNLAGETLAQRWSSEIKRKILESRTITPALFLDALSAIESKPRVYVCASAIGYYGTSETQTFTEESAPGNDFLADVCTQWERVASSAHDIGMRVACVRAGLVLAADGGALAKLLPIFRSGAGGRVGSGNQWYSWIHVDDAVGIYLTALDRLEGAVNATAPNPVRNTEFAHTLARALHRPAVLPTPTFALKLALGEGATLVLDGQRVLPQRALREGYAFKFPTLEQALSEIVG